MKSWAGEIALVAENKLPTQALNEHRTALAFLIERAASGETAAFEQIMIRSEQKVLATTWRLLGNEADARDAAQEVFLRVYKYLGRFKPDHDFFAWVYQITINVCHDIAKQRQLRNNRFISLDAGDDEGTLDLPAGQEDAEQALIRAQRREMIARAMQTLPEKERAAIVLRDIEGLSTEDVARILKSSSTTVRSQISSARRKIKLYCERRLKRKGRVTD